MGDVVLVPLRGKGAEGKFALIDATDAPRVLNHPWYLNNWGYVTRMSRVSDGFNPRRRILLHRLINETPDGLHTDHIDGDKLNNRGRNLRSATIAQNKMNCGVQANSTSGYCGVTRKKNGRWMAQIGSRSAKRYLGYYDNADEAAAAYNEAVIEVYGEFARINEIP
jgi:hypothetical protein